MAPDPGLSAEDLALIERLALRVVELRLETPAILALESGRPLTLVASQALLFFEPLVQTLFGFGDSKRWSELVARREALDEIVRRIEHHAELQRTPRRDRSGVA